MPTARREFMRQAAAAAAAAVAGVPLPGLYPMNEQTKQRYEADKGGA